MPVFAHIMLALVYITASVVGAVALHQYYGFDAIMAGVIGATVALAAVQLHMAVSRLSGGDVDKQFFELRQEIRKLTARVAQAEQYAADLKGSFDKEVAARR